ncbi:MAG: dephospho-CoA kinase, partial [Gemmiger sp.]
MKTIGITGRSGCGKSSVTAALLAQGYPCVDADQLSREILQPGSPCLPQLQQAFGEDILLQNGVLQRRLLADRAFATPEGTQKLTEITFPEIVRRILAARDRAAAQGNSLFFVDGAVIIDTPFERNCDKIIVVTTPYEESVRRICARDGISAEMARRRLDAQVPEDVLRAHADFVIENNSTPHALEQ